MTVQRKRTVNFILPVRTWFKNFYFREAVIFISMFSLTMLHEWITIDSAMNLFKGIVFFLLIYVQAQIHRYYIFPLFFKKNLFKYFALLTCSTVVIGGLLLAADYFWIQPWLYQDEDLVLSFAYYCVIGIISTFTIMAFSLMAEYSVETQKRNEDQLLMNEMSIKFLSAQLNPHFFFNMLNNLYGVSLTEPARTPELIIKLSNLMRYQIENANKTTVNLAAEIQFIENYIDLEKERIGKRCEVTFSYLVRNRTLDQYEIAPLLLITLVENAFKHSLTNDNWFVSTSITLDQNELTMIVENSLPDNEKIHSSTGTGLMNLRQRLDYLYHGNSSLVQKINDQSFHTTLALSLKKQTNGQN
ncbi:histidine kinase [Terrimonas sp. NA20]|uniref:Histidine kinase n=1 Tax=Terrimonas ginsenosidimutans TaxID=2908004 RepID=A0ABS9KM98_9BACT|nr:histidine kinase [Terrimonas ginsenosidimutans]MCG2613450.1 histidine kinase [Terrimonas ginsenosidimutans]